MKPLMLVFMWDKRSLIALHYRVAYGTFMYHPNQDSTFLILGNEETQGERQNEQTVRLPSHVLQSLLDHHIPSSLSEEHNPQQIISIGFQLHQCLVWGRDYISGYTLFLQLTSRIQSFSTRICLVYTYPSPRDISGDRMPSSA